MRKVCFTTLQVSGRTYSYSLPDMAEAHRQSFFKFLNQGLLEELEQIFPIYLNKGKIQVILDYEFHSKGRLLLVALFFVA